MTIVVGMVGSDGIVLATDRRRTIPATNEAQYDDYADIRKVVHLADHKISYAGVGDQTTKAVGKHFATLLSGYKSNRIS
jgi:hypothetical protein